QKQRILRRAQPPGLNIFRRSGPEVHEALQAEAKVSSIVNLDVFDCLPPARCDVSRLSHRYKLMQGGIVLSGMKVNHPCSVGAITISQPELRAEVIAHQNQLAEHLIVAGQPRRKAYAENHRSQHNPSQRLPSTLGSPVPTPQP